MWTELLAAHTEKGAYDLIAYNRSKTTFTHPQVNIVPLHEIHRATLIFICTSISSLPEVLSALSPVVNPTALICDTCSVKVYAQQCMEEILPKECALLGSHPMFGPDSLHCSATLPIVLCPIRISEARMQQCSQLCALWGLESINMSAQAHDEMSAYSQGFTHLIGRIAQDMQLTPLNIATLGYQKILQVMAQTCKDSRKLFLDLERYNPYTKNMLLQFNKSVEKICAEIATTPK